MLSAMGRTAHWDRRDRSYSFDRVLQDGVLHIGFVIRIRKWEIVNRQE